MKLTHLDGGDGPIVTTFEFREGWMTLEVLGGKKLCAPSSKEDYIYIQSLLGEVDIRNLPDRAYGSSHEEILVLEQGSLMKGFLRDSPASSVRSLLGGAGEICLNNFGETCRVFIVE